jgi:hypothetical protein
MPVPSHEGKRLPDQVDLAAWVFYDRKVRKRQPTFTLRLFLKLWEASFPGV